MCACHGNDTRDTCFFGFGFGLNETASLIVCASTSHQYIYLAYVHVSTLFHSPQQLAQLLPATARRVGYLCRLFSRLAPTSAFQDLHCIFHSFLTCVTIASQGSCTKFVRATGRRSPHKDEAAGLHVRLRHWKMKSRQAEQWICSHSTKRSSNVMWFPVNVALSCCVWYVSYVQ